MSDYREHLAQFKRDMDNPPPAITPEQRQMLDDWQCGHDEDYPEVFYREERERARANADRYGLTAEYVRRLERIAHASLALLQGSEKDPKQKALWDALRAVNLFEDEGL